MDNREVIKKLVGLEEEILLDELLSEDTPYGRYVRSLAKLLKVPPEDVARSKAAINYYKKYISYKGLL